MQRAGLKDKGRNQDPRKAGNLEMGEGEAENTRPSFCEERRPVYTLGAQMHSQLPELEADKLCCFKLLNLWTHYIVSNNSTNISERHHAVWSGAFWIGYEMSPEVRVFEHLGPRWWHCFGRLWTFWAEVLAVEGLWG